MYRDLRVSINFPFNSTGELTCPGATEADQGAYSCEAINSKGSCFAGSTGCGQPGNPFSIHSQTKNTYGGGGGGEGYPFE